MILTSENYYTSEADLNYCSASQYKDFIGCPRLHGCEARAMARINGEYTPPVSKALLIGSLVDALWEGADADTLLRDFPDCVSTKGPTKGQLKTEFRQAFDLYARGRADKNFAQYMSGEKQVIMTGNIGGLPFKIKMDSYIEGKAIVDLKTTENESQDFRYYIPDLGQRLPFYSAWGYQTQLAIYQEIVKQNTGDKLPCFIAAVDKKEYPRLAIIKFEEKDLYEALEEVKSHVDIIGMLKAGEVEPTRCESDECNYCRQTSTAGLYTTSEFETHDEGRNE